MYLAYSPKKAIAFSAIIFGILHLNPFQVSVTIILGLFLGWIFLKTKSIGNTIILHFTANFIVLLQSYLEFKFLDFELVTTVNIIILPIAIVLLLFMVKKLIKKMNCTTIGI